MEQLATRCPHCQTQFRVTMAQLELREGKVRCGTCREVFNGIDTVFELGSEPDFALTPPSAPDLSDRMTLIDFGALRGMPTAPAPNMQDELDALSRAIADLQSKPWSEPPATPQSEFADDTDDTDKAIDLGLDLGTGTAAPPEPDASAAGTTAADAEAPGFVQQARRRQRSARVWAWLLWTGIPLLLLALAAQLTYHFRHDIAARSPETAPLLRAACAQLGCAIRLPMKIDQLSLANSRLDALGEGSGQFLLVAVLSNRGDSVLAWPSLDLQLKDAEGKVVVRRAFLPNQYAKPDELRTGMPMRTEREIRIPFELSGDAPENFELTLFYH